MYRTIVVPLDGSPRAERILPHVTELAKRFGARVILVRVVTEEHSLVAPIDYQVAVRASLPNQPVAHEESQYVIALSYLEHVQMRLQNNRVEANAEVLDGPVVQAIIEVAQKENADLIAMASHGRTGLGQVFYGSVAAGLLHRADRPLLIIRAQDQPA